VGVFISKRRSDFKRQTTSNDIDGYPRTHSVAGEVDPLLTKALVGVKNPNGSFTRTCNSDLENEKRLTIEDSKGECAGR